MCACQQNQFAPPPRLKPAWNTLLWKQLPNQTSESEKNIFFLQNVFTVIYYTIWSKQLKDQPKQIMIDNLHANSQVWMVSTNIIGAD